jgi:hypothetical protein
MNRPQFARHLAVIQNDYDRGDYEQQEITQGIQEKGSQASY